MKLLTAALNRFQLMIKLGFSMLWIYSGGTQSWMFNQDLLRSRWFQENEGQNKQAVSNYCVENSFQGKMTLMIINFDEGV